MICADPMRPESSKRPCACRADAGLMPPRMRVQPAILSSRSPKSWVKPGLGQTPLCARGRAAHRFSGDWVDFVAKALAHAGAGLFRPAGPLRALFAPAGDEFAPALRWPKERWASLAHALIEQGVEPTIVGGPSAREVGRYVAHVTPARARPDRPRPTWFSWPGLAARRAFAFGEDGGFIASSCSCRRACGDVPSRSGAASC